MTSRWPPHQSQPQPPPAQDGQARASLEAELKRLEEQLERQRLEQEILRLQSQLNSGGGFQMGQQQSSYDDKEEVIEEVEVVEEWEEEEDIEEEAMIEEVEDPPPQPTRPVCTVRDVRGPPVTNVSIQGRETPSAAPVPQRRSYQNSIQKMNPFTQNLAEKKAEAERAEQEKAARAAEAQPKPRITDTSAESDGPLPDLPPFTPRTIPKLPESPSGNETPMELILGPKLYKQGKLIATTTVSGCADQEMVMLYFGAGWRRECKDFDRLLTDFYTIAAIPNKIECIYISSDRNLQEFKSYFSKTPYLSMVTQTSALKNALARNLKLIDWPSLVVMDPSTGLVVTTDGVKDIENLQRRDVAQCHDLVKKWKSTRPIQMSEVIGDTRLKHGTMDRGYLYWQE